MKQSAAATVLIALVFLLSSVGAQTNTTRRLSVKHNEALLFTAPDETSIVIAKLNREQEIFPMADVRGAGGQLWYLIRAKSGAVGWMRPADIEQHEKLEDLFKTTPPEPLVSTSPDFPSTPSAKIPENAVAIPIEMSGTVVIVPVLLNRSLKARMILDTGATSTLISRRIANKLGLSLGPSIVMVTANGATSAPLARLGSIKVGEAEAFNFLVPVHNFHPDPTIEGLLGLDFLQRFHITIDSRRRLLILARR